MSAKTRDFAAKARTIVGGSRPTSLKDFLEDERGAGNTESRADDVRKIGNTESRTDDVRKTGNTEDQATQPRSDLARIVSMKGAMVAKSTEREEFRFDSDLAERLRRCAFETRQKKTSIVKEALERYLREQGF